MRVSKRLERAGTVTRLEWDPEAEETIVGVVGADFELEFTHDGPPFDMFHLFGRPVRLLLVSDADS